MSRDSIRIAVHDGTYHTDDVFALAIAVLWAHGRNYDCAMVRTRDTAELMGCQVVLDVGGEYDPARHRMDHHQLDFAETRPNGIGYASAGLAWKHYGLELCRNDTAVWQMVDDALIAGIDAADIGVGLMDSTHPSAIMSPSLSYIVGLSRPTRTEELANPTRAMNDAFWRIYEQAKHIVQRAIVHGQDYMIGKKKVLDAYHQATDKRVVVCEFEYPAWIDALTQFPEPVYFVYQRSDGSWGAKGVRVNGEKSFEIRKEFPLSWAGQRDTVLQELTGVPDARFVHRGRFMAVAESQGGVLRLAEIALTA